jgi:hypothetical protein
VTRPRRATGSGAGHRVGAWPERRHRLRVRRAQRRSSRGWRRDAVLLLGRRPYALVHQLRDLVRTILRPGCDAAQEMRMSFGRAQRQRCEVPVIAGGTIGEAVSSASLLAPWCGEPTASGASTRVPCGNITTSPPLDRRGRSRSPGHPPRRAASERSEAEEQPARWAFELLDLGREAHVAAGGDPDEESVQDVLVIRSDDHQAGAWSLLVPRALHPEPCSQHQDCQQSSARIQGGARCRSARQLVDAPCATGILRPPSRSAV